MAGITADVLARPGARLKAGKLINFVAQQVGGKGGGKPDLAMAGGCRVPLREALPASGNSPLRVCCRNLWPARINTCRGAGRAAPPGVSVCHRVALCRADCAALHLKLRA